MTSLKQQHSDYARIIQITDTHIQADPDDDFDGINTRQSLDAVLQFVRKNVMPCDAMLVTGDLVHVPVVQAYTALAGMLQRIDVPVFCIPGNHDDPDLMEKFLNTENISTAKHLQFTHWQLCLLNTWLPGTHAGRLQQDELHFLDNSLRNNGDRHALVVLHHPPVPIDSPWMDKMRLENPGELFSVIDQYPAVRAIIWGHIHQEFSSRHGDILLLAAPSTCVQFMPKAAEYTKDMQPPGCRVLQLHKSGKIDTYVRRMEITE